MRSSILLYVGISFRPNGTSIVAVDGTSEDPKAVPWKLFDFRRCRSFDDIAIAIADIVSAEPYKYATNKSIKLLSNDVVISNALPKLIDRLNSGIPTDSRKDDSPEISGSALLAYLQTAIASEFLERSDDPKLDELQSNLAEIQFLPDGKIALTDKDTSPAEAFLLSLGLRVADWLQNLPPDHSWMSM